MHPQPLTLARTLVSMRLTVSVMMVALVPITTCVIMGQTVLIAQALEVDRATLVLKQEPVPTVMTMGVVVVIFACKRLTSAMIAVPLTVAVSLDVALTW